MILIRGVSSLQGSKCTQTWVFEDSNSVLVWGALLIHTPCLFHHSFTSFSFSFLTHVSSVTSGDRSHVIERRYNARSGEREENQEFINLDESKPRSVHISIDITITCMNCFMYMYMFN